MCTIIFADIMRSPSSQSSRAVRNSARQARKDEIASVAALRTENAILTRRLRKQKKSAQKKFDSNADTLFLYKDSYWTSQSDLRGAEMDLARITAERNAAYDVSDAFEERLIALTAAHDALIASSHAKEIAMAAAIHASNTAKAATDQAYSQLYASHDALQTENAKQTRALHELTNHHLDMLTEFMFSEPEGQGPEGADLPPPLEAVAVGPSVAASVGPLG
jgi:hypothetical protein